MSDYTGNPGEEAVFTAFGQRIDGSPRRFGYAGEWGYQSTLDDQTPPAEVFPFLHVGARYYDPATSRFLQRDAIGIAGGLNVYGYVESRPTIDIDPDGLIPIGGYPPYMPPPPAPKPKPTPLPPQPRPEPPSPEDELESIRRNEDAWDLGYAALCIAAGVTPGAQPIAIGLGLGVLARKAAQLIAG